MKKLTKKDIIKQTFYWGKKLNLLPFEIIINNRMKWNGCVGYDRENRIITITINIKSLIENPQEMQEFIFHELGHIKYRTWNWKNKMKSEYLAEKFALKNIKKYCPKQYLEHKKIWTETMKDKKWQKKYPIHYKAFSRIYK